MRQGGRSPRASRKWGATSFLMARSAPRCTCVAGDGAGRGRAACARAPHDSDASALQPVRPARGAARALRGECDAPSAVHACRALRPVRRSGTSRTPTPRHCRRFARPQHPVRHGALRHDPKQHWTAHPPGQRVCAAAIATTIAACRCGRLRRAARSNSSSRRVPLRARLGTAAGEFTGISSPAPSRPSWAC